jgi:hypothetical protein
MKTVAADGSRDPAIEDPSNLWLVHPLSRAGLTWAIRHRISANMVSIAGLVLGMIAALAYFRWDQPMLAFLGLLFSIGWLVADGLDGMVARATGTSSATGRILDGLCDHGVFVCIYIALLCSLGFWSAFPLAATAGVLHAAQSSLYEGERARYHRRIRGDGRAPESPLSSNPGVRLYESVFHALDRWAAPFDRRLLESSEPARLAQTYREAARLPMKYMSLLSANMRVFAIYIACATGDPRLFWWFEIIPLTLIAISAILWHRYAEQRIIG